MNQHGPAIRIATLQHLKHTTVLDRYLVLPPYRSNAALHGMILGDHDDAVNHLLARDFGRRARPPPELVKFASRQPPLL